MPDLVGTIASSAGSALSGMTGGFWNGEAEEDTVRPLAVLAYAVEQEEQYSDGSYLERGTLTATIYATESAAAADRANEFANWLALPATKTTLNGLGLKIRRLMRAQHSHVPSEMRNAQGNVVYMATVPFTVQVQGNARS